MINKLHIGRRRLIFYLVTVAALLVIFFKFSEIRLIGRAFLGANIFWITGVIIAQISSYYYLALNYRDVLRVKDLEISIKDIFPMTFVIQFLNQAIPSATISGQIFFIQHLRRYGLSIAEGIGRAILEIFTLAVAFGFFFIAATILLAMNSHLADIPIVTFIIYIFLFISMLSIFAFFAFQKRRRGKLSNGIIGFIHKRLDKYDTKNRTKYVSVFIDQMRENLHLDELAKKKSLILKATLWQGMILVVNTISLLFISYAIGAGIPITVAFIAFTLTKFISMIAFIPGGLGVFEGGMTLILISFNVPASSALAMTLLFRAFTFWLPMPFGWALYRYFIHRQELENPGD